jgi:hypothetical protein
MTPPFRSAGHARRACLAAAALAFLPIAAAAQACLGLTPLESVKANLVGEYRIAEDQSAAGAGVAFGIGAQPFVDLGYARLQADEADIGAHRFRGALGIQLAPRRAGGWRGCPLLGVTYEDLDRVEFFGSSIDASVTTLLIGFGIGRTRGDPATLALSPFATAHFAVARATASFGGFSATESQEYGLVELGVAARFSEVVAVRPSVQLPVGLGEPDVVLGLTVAIGVGRR